MSTTIKSPLPLLAQSLRKLGPYVGFAIFLLFAAVYGFLILQISSLSNPAVDSSAVLAETKASPTPRIDNEAIKQLQSLQDNSVSVQTLFDQGRANPFEE